MVHPCYMWRTLWRTLYINSVCLKYCCNTLIEDKFKIHIIGITKSGIWQYYDNTDFYETDGSIAGPQVKSN